MKSVFYTPENLDLPALLMANGYYDLAKPLHLSKCYYMIDLLYLRKVINKSIGWKDYLPVHSRVLQKVIGDRKSTAIKKALVDVGVLETDGRYRIGEKSIGYRFAPQYRKVTFRATEIYDKKLPARIRKLNEQEIAAAIKDSKARQAIQRTIQRLQIDFTAAWGHLAGTVYKSKAAWMRRKIVLSRFQNKQWIFRPDEQGRIYNLFVLLAGDLRQFATIGGEPIFQCDFCSMQPALLAGFYPENCEEKWKYAGLVMNGSLYDFLNARLGEPYNLKDREEKRELKDRLFGQVLFCYNHVARKSELGQIFEQEFPILYRAIWDFKEKNPNPKDGAKRKGVSALPRLLQKQEAALVIEGVISDLVSRHPEIDVISIHDCIATTARWVPIVQAEMKLKIVEALGFPVKVKTERITRELPLPAAA